MRNNYLLTKYVVPALAAYLFLTGFTDFLFKENVIEEVENFKNQTKNSTTPKVSLENMDAKALAPYRPYKFESGLANPFVIKNFVGRQGIVDAESDQTVCDDENCGDGPPLAHAKYFLENYNIDQLAMIGTMTDKRRGRVALIQTPDSGVVYAANGEYIGRNNGLILSVNTDRVIIREKYRSPKGWQDRMARLPLLKK